jgi:hypothetical protein
MAIFSYFNLRYVRWKIAKSCKEQEGLAAIKMLTAFCFLATFDG